MHNAGLKALNFGQRFDPDELKRVLQAMWIDAWTSGQRIAADQIDEPVRGQGWAGEAASAIDWSTWQPGDLDAAGQAMSGGLRALLEEQGATIRGISDTTTDRIGDLIGQGLAVGAPVDSVASLINDYVDNPDRAFVIAQTETSRAMIAGQADEYQAQGFAQFEWLAYDGACDECLEQEDSNPHEFGDEQPPGHPNCRCSIVGTGEVTTPEGALDVPE